MTCDPEQDTADLRRQVRRLVEAAGPEQLHDMAEAYQASSAGVEYEVRPIMRDGVQIGTLSVPRKAGTG